MTVPFVPAALAAFLVLTGCGTSDGTEDNATALAEIRCETSATVTQAAPVRVQPDGIHLRIENVTDRAMAVYRQADGDIGPLVEADVGVTDAVSTAAPGPWGVLCVSRNAYPVEDDPWAALEVVDPDGIWVSDVLECETITGSHPDYRADFEGGTPRGVEGDPVEMSRASIAGAGFPVRDDDVLERAGYPEAEGALVRVVRSGSVVAIGRWQQDGRGGWIDRGAEYCEDA
jgi:hypothetical protein